MAFTSVALMGAGAASNTVGAYFGAKNTKNALAYQANIADLNAGLSEKAAESELLKGEREEQSARLKTAQVKSAQRAAMAANGIDLGSETPTRILNSTDVMGEIDANTIKRNAIASAWGYRIQGAQYGNEALVGRATARGINPTTQALSTMLTSAGQVAGSWYTLNKVGAFDRKTTTKTDPLVSSNWAPAPPSFS